ncbi:agip37 [Agrotis ipsilon multiple nucleopolyhedrovirus]|uniref:Uncharacterized protein n=1 Tax=Agrotis ipsilon multiple nucleopolyhedrovirus TaxID=208013 RepID=B6D5V1_9ABAC|nr:agip37 [Agrotis ipsilon multiple nucleopolyhedrovirus]ACI28739.1 unknown [Agrotis ipsilon multiple nucleopolyhedrovirus]
MDVERLLIRLGRENETPVKNFVVAVSDLYDHVKAAVKRPKFKRLATKDRVRLLLDITENIAIMKDSVDSGCDGHILYDSYYYSRYPASENDTEDSGNDDDSDGEFDDNEEEEEEEEEEEIELGILRRRNGNGGALSSFSQWTTLFKLATELFSWLRCWIWSKCEKPWYYLWGGGR